MSGPKVIRVKTRGERIAEAERWIGRVASAARRWEQRVSADGLASAPDIVAAHAHVVALTRLLANDHFAELERHARQAIAFLDDDLARRRERLAEQRARQHGRRRRLASAAASLLATLADAGTNPPPAARALLERGRTGDADNLDALESAIGESVLLLVPAEDTTARNARQAALATRLDPGEITRTLADWLSDRPSEDDGAANRMDRDIARLESEASAAIAAPFAERARQIAAEPLVRRRRLLLDSLGLDLAATLHGWRTLERIRGQLEDLASELAPLVADPQAVALLDEIAATIAGSSGGILQAADPATGPAGDLAALHQRGIDWLADYHAVRAAQGRRDAVLSALSAIGYEVREGMGTLWGESRRLVVRHGASQDIGLELAGDPTAGRLQLRAVGFETAPDTWDHGRDRDIEQGFCTHLQQLGAQLDAHGGELALERAVPAGTQPLRTLAAAEGPTERVAQARPRQGERAL
ncbi:hypothetical protein [uncultured Lamprocystis sp.]|jgi:hypothetical protein|uniref:hypothetical protein n=1 Tax=uncultured Lamprocystis sp. TaxID=543132 RepID=UPI0025F2C4B0|nr:hypothetical protein [uncultured Lamprocystis sp.]